MTKIKIVNDRTGEIKEIDCIGYNLQFVTSDGDGRVQKIRELNNGKYDCKHWIKNDIYYPIAKKVKANLIELSPALTSVNIENILFLEDIDYVTDEINRKTDWVMKIKKAPAQLTQLTGYKFIIESREFWMGNYYKPYS